MQNDPEPNEFPNPEELADESDQDGWDGRLDGRMSDFATDDDAVPTADYDETADPEADEVLEAEVPDAEAD